MVHFLLITTRCFLIITPYFDCQYCFSYFVFSDSLPDFAGIDVSNPNCVVLGDSQHEFTYDNLNKAFRVLMGLDKPILFALGGGLVTYPCCLSRI